MARAKLMLMDSEYEFYNIIKMLDKIIPNNSNAKYYTFLHELLNQKMKIKSLIKEIMKFKKKQSANETYGMIRSDGLHIDAILATYLYEDGKFRQAYNLLSSVKENGFTTELTETYLCKMKNMSGEQ